MQLVGPVVIRCQAFSAGTLVRIQGLQSAPELNGREAKIVNFDQADMWPFAALVLCCIMGHRGVEAKQEQAQLTPGVWIESNVNPGLINPWYWIMTIGGVPP